MYSAPKYDLIHQMLDGTIKMTNPLTGRTAWWVPGRSGRPLTNVELVTMEHTEIREPEDYCAFCPLKLIDTPPEIERRVRDGDGYRNVVHLFPDKIIDSNFSFRRMTNLYEIVTLDYWRRNYDYRGLDSQREWANEYKLNPEGREHVLALIRTRHEALRNSGEELPEMSEPEMLAEADSFFFGCHQLIVGARHYQPGVTAGQASTLLGSGALTPEEHDEYFRFTSDAIRDIYETNRYVRYVVTFQNWLRPAGASFDHLHKQLVGLDDWGTSLNREVRVSRTDPNVYNSMVVNYASYNNLVIAENEHAVLFADFGYRNPTLSVYSKSRNLRPFEHTWEELRAVSDLVHAAHAAQGPEISCNEEWYYQPRDCLEKIPFHVLIKWRISNPAGFEGGTRIFVNPLRPYDVRDELVPRLFSLRAEGRIADNLQIAEECPVEPNSLLYNR